MLWYNQPGFGSAPAPKHTLSFSLMLCLCLSVFLNLFHPHKPSKPKPWRQKKLHPLLQYPLDILLVPVAKLNGRGQSKDKTTLIPSLSSSDMSTLVKYHWNFSKQVTRTAFPFLTHTHRQTQACTQTLTLCWRSQRQICWTWSPSPHLWALSCPEEACTSSPFPEKDRIHSDNVWQRYAE